jgi:protease-4
MVQMIRKARDDKQVKAIVLRLQSGGGSALASDIIWYEVKEAQKKKPVIVSIGDMAASGAYYIACAADVIVANPGSIVGSIGVFGGKLVTQGLYQKLGLKKEAIGIGDKINAFSESRPFSETEKAMLEKEIKIIYKTFKDRVAEGRKLDSAALEPVVEGRIFTGNQAIENGLVDELGGLGRAIEIAKEKAHINSKEVQLDLYPKQPGLWSAVKNNDLRQAKLSLNRISESLERDNIWALAPWCIIKN